MRKISLISLIALLLICEFQFQALAFSFRDNRCVSASTQLLMRSNPSDQSEYIQTQLQAKEKILKSSIKTVLPFAASLVGYFAAKTSVQAAKQPNAYLTEPTEKFREELAKQQEFSETRAKIKSIFEGLLKDFQAAEKPEDLMKELLEMETFLSKVNDMPTGIPKKEIVRICRAKKFMIVPNVRKPRRQPNWTDEVESAYVKLILTIDRLLAPGSVGGVTI